MAGHHFYSTNPNKDRYELEELAGYVMSNLVAGAVPLYRFYTPVTKNYYYNISPDEPKNYVADGSEGFVFSSTTTDRTPFYRFYYPGTVDYSSESMSPAYIPGTDRYLYSTDPTIPEGYRFQGIEGYLVTTAGPDRSPLYRFKNRTTNDRYYSLVRDEPSGYDYESTEGYVFTSPGPDRAHLNAGYAGDRHFYTISSVYPEGFEPEWSLMFVFATAGPDRLPLYRLVQIRDDDDSGGFLSDVGKFFSDAVDTVVGAVTSVANAVRETIENTIGIVVNLVSYPVGWIISIPYLGRLVGWILHFVQAVVMFFVGLPEFVLSYIGIRPEKRLKLCVVIQRDENGGQVADPVVVKEHLEAAIATFKNEANVRIIPAGPFLYSTAFDSPSSPDAAFIYIENDPSGPRTLDCQCDSEGFVDDLGVVGSEFESKVIKASFWSSGRRLVGFGAPICAFAIRGFSGKPSKRGCSFGPMADHLLVFFINPENPLTNDQRRAGLRTRTTLAHEIGHTCNLLIHADDDDKDNLMTGSGPRGTSLSRLQIAFLRSSRHVMLT